MTISLDKWRKKASFVVRELQDFLYTAEVVELKNRVWDTLAKDPLFSIPNKELTLIEKRELSFRRTKRLVEYGFLGSDITNPLKKVAVVAAVLPLDVGSVIHYKISIEVCVCVRACTYIHLFLQSYDAHHILHILGYCNNLFRCFIPIYTQIFGGCLLGYGTTRVHRKFYEDCLNMKVMEVKKWFPR